MERMEYYWSVASHLMSVMDLFLEGWLFYRFVKPFMKKKAYYVGVSYTAVMLVFYFVPMEITYPRLQAAFAALIVMYLADRRNLKQKVFLATAMYLFRWVVYGVVLVLRDILFALFITAPYMLTKPVGQLAAYVMVELVYYGITGTIMYMVIRLIHKVYVNKKEDLSGKELLLLLATLLTVMTGYLSFSFFSTVYEKEMSSYIWNTHPEYTALRVVYQIVSFAAIMIAIVIYQKLKEKQREEKVNMLLSEQIENTKQHIREVEKLYGDIRALKHDIGNHISVLENLFLKNETEEFQKYLSELKAAWSESVAEIKTGNPVTDVILTQRKKEAEEKGIEFRCEFIYPADMSINAFDVSVIVNNAIANAFEGTKSCKNPYVSISAYCRKNAYMLEVKNGITHSVEIDEETGLPETTKEDKGSHGFGLANIRKVAQQYHGDIDISQDENSFTLTVMLMSS